MNEWDTYRLLDFVPFTREVYFRLLERVGESFWPLQFVGLIFAGASIWLALRGRARIALLLLAPWWVVVGVIFFLQRYATLNWAGEYIGWVFIAEGVALSVLALFGAAPAVNSTSPIWHKASNLSGIVIAVFGFIGLPATALLQGYSRFQAEVFGLHADPTAMVTLGVVLIAVRRAYRWIAAAIPLIWLLLSALTQSVLGIGSSLAIYSVIAAGLLGVAWRD
ncbi:DUF4175 domain-containing protein [Microbulbifer aggregans]|uniref:DUF4175 domain-containing protein n=1 Tax=Microbulbifer aggregans TaxID=1769779 RepID=UPI001CFDEA2F|nr:DUF4175 domain-containing protein [Microbulbifer aggregans]